MERWKRRIRGAIGMGLAWAAAWFGAGMVLLAIVGPDAADVPFPLGFGALGFLAGVTFSGILGLVEGRRSFHEMSLPRFALWGALGGFSFSALFVTVTGLGGWAYLGLGGIFAASGAVCAAGSLALARRADDPGALDGPDGREGRALGGGGAGR